jgi:large subunit ribosomal protein L25
MKTIALAAQPRTDKNTRSARRHRANGRVPAVLYGGALPDGKANHEVKHLTVGKDELNLLLKKHGLLIDLQLGGSKEVAILKEVQRDALGEFVMHVDFERVDLTKPIHVDVELIYKGTPKGATQGGHLRIEAYKLAIEALVTDVPDNIIIKVDDLELDQVLRLKDITLPPRVKALADAEQALCAVRAAIEEKEPEPGAAPEGPAEPEVIGRKKEEEEEGAEGEAEEKPAAKEKKKE